jgi:hypothetical protein
MNIFLYFCLFRFNIRYMKAGLKVSNYQKFTSQIILNPQYSKKRWWLSWV